jgi:3-phytase
MKNYFFLFLFTLGCSIYNDIDYPSEINYFEVYPSSETQPVSSKDDAADDIAIWINDLSVENSIIIGTNKQVGLDTYNLSGDLIKSYTFGRINNVDIFQEFNVGEEKFPLVIGSNRTDNTIFLGRLYSDGSIKKILKNDPKSFIEEVYGITSYNSNDMDYVFISGKDGTLEQWLIEDNKGTINMNLIRTIKFNSIVEGLVSDSYYEKLYVAEETVGLWEININPNIDLNKKLIFDTDKRYFKPDFEGVTLYKKDNGEGYIFISIQGSNSYAVLDRKSKEFKSVFRIKKSNNIDSVSDTDGIDLSQLSTNKFPEGLFIVQDGDNDNQNQNFKFVNLSSILDKIYEKP